MPYFPAFSGKRNREARKQKTRKKKMRDLQRSSRSSWGGRPFLEEERWWFDIAAQCQFSNPKIKKENKKYSKWKNWKRSFFENFLWVSLTLSLSKQQKEKYALFYPKRIFFALNVETRLQVSPKSISTFKLSLFFFQLFTWIIIKFSTGN